MQKYVKKFLQFKMTQTPGQRLKFIRNMINLSREEVYAKYGIPASSLRSWELGRNKLGLKALYRCIECYKKEGIIFSSEWVLEGKGLEPQRISQLKDLFQEPRAGEIKDDGILMLKEMQYIKSLHPSAIILQIADDDMLPYYKRGDYIVGLPCERSKWLLLDKSCCVVELSSGIVVVRQFIVIDKEKNLISLTTTNPCALAKEPIIYQPHLSKVAPIIIHRRPINNILL